MCLHIAAFLAVYVLLQLIHCPSVDKRSSIAAPSTNKSSEDSLAKPFSSDFSATFLIHIGSLESSLVETGEIERKFSRYFQNSYQLCKFVSVLVPAYARHIYDADKRFCLSLIVVARDCSVAIFRGVAKIKILRYEVRDRLGSHHKLFQYPSFFKAFYHRRGFHHRNSLHGHRSVVRVPIRELGGHRACLRVQGSQLGDQVRKSIAHECLRQAFVGQEQQVGHRSPYSGSDLPFRAEKNK